MTEKSNPKATKQILLVDNFDSFTYNLVQAIDNPQYQVTVLRNNDPNLEQIAEKSDAIIFSPGPGWPKDAGLMEEIIKKFQDKKPILGICLGHQAIFEVNGGKLRLAKKVMHGKTSNLEIEDSNSFGNTLFANLSESNPEIMRYHSIVGDEGTLPENFRITARTSDDNEIMAIEHKDLPIFGLQFHPESIGTPQGKIIIENFLNTIK